MSCKIDLDLIRALRGASLSLNSAEREGSSRDCQYMTIIMSHMSSMSKRQVNSANMINMIKDST